jgi:glycosyltransferase involved in cell wall biosynthesis
MNNVLDQITPLILTFNEEANLSRTLAGLGWARRIVVIDSGSTDATLEVLAAHSNVEVVHRPFDTHGCQWNAGLALISQGWVLSLDADYVVTPSLQQALVAAINQAESSGSPASSEGCTNGFQIPFRYCVAGRPLRGTVLPPRIALFRCGCGEYIDDGHTQDLMLRGRVGLIPEPILHDDRKPLDRWLWAQQRYMRRETDKLLHTPDTQLSRADRLRKRTWLAPLAVLLVCLVQKRACLDGWRGWFYAFQRSYAELLLLLMLMDARRISRPASA